MADNVTANAGSGGAVFATDDVGGIHYPISKITIGALDAAGSLALGGTGAVAAGCLRVTVATDDAIVTALQLIDDAVYTDGSGTPSKGLGVCGTDGTNPQLLSVNSSGHLNIADGGNVLSIDWNGTAPPIGAGTETAALRVTLANDSTGLVSVDDNSGSLTIDGNVGLVPVTSGGLTPFYSVDIDETEEDVKTSAGQVYGIICVNTATAPRYLKFYNATAASVTVGTTAPHFTVAVPSQGTANGAGFVINLPMGVAFDTAISVACTTGAADNDTGAPATGDVKVTVFYK